MRPMRLFNKTFTLFIVTLFVVSFALAGNSAAIPQNNAESSVETSYLTNPSPVSHSAPAAQGTNVDWYTDVGNYNDTWTWSNNNWMFGPKANYELFFNNGTQIDRLDFIPLGEEIIWRVNVPKNVLRGAGLQNVYVNGWYMTQDMNFSASFSLDFYNYTVPTWSTWSYSENYTSGYSAPPYVSINQPGCNFTSDEAMYYVTFKVTFNVDTPKGLYSPYATIHDDIGNSYDVRSRYSTDTMMFEYIAIGIPITEAYSYTYQGGYTLEKRDLAGDVIYSVSRETDFMMRFNITGNDDLAYAALWTMFNGNMQIPVTKTGEHIEMVTKTGGWEYDPVLETYFYNSSAEFTVPEMVWGEYTVYDNYYFGSDYRYHDYRYTSYNMTTDSWDVVTYETMDEMRLMYIYNFTSLSWEIIYGFTYWTYPLEYYQPDVNQEQVWYTEPVENAPFIIYELNEGLSNVYSQDGVVSVEFVGHFTNDAPKGAIVHFNDRVVSTEGYDYGVSAGDIAGSLMTWQEYNAAKEVAVESPVTIAKLLSADDSKIYSWFFPADPGTPFEVQGRLQGGADLAADIDGALFEMKSYDSFWSENTYGYTDMYYEILVDADGTVTLTSYNYTAMQNLTWGYHWEWGEILVTGWHYEYNETSGDTEWVYGDYMTYTDEWVEGWYYEWYYYNQKDGEWVTSADWYYYGIKSEMTKTNVVFAEVSNISTYTQNGDLYYSFLVNLTDSISEITHWWDFQFANNTWVEDPSSGMGFHDIGVWRPGWIYSLDYMGEDLYVDISSEIGVYNGAIPGIDDWLSVEERPYITINGVDYPIRVREISDPYSSYSETRILFNDNMGYYYELLNGTKISIKNEWVAKIYNVTVPGYGSFISAQKDPMYYDDTDNFWLSWWDIDGNLHQGIDHMMWSSNVMVEVLDVSEAEYAGYYMRIGAWDVLEVQDYPRNDPRTGTNYVLDLDGTRYDLTYDYYYGGYEIFYEGAYQHASHVYESMNATYMGSPAFVPEYYVMQEQWFTVDGNYEMPYPGAEATWSGVYYTSSHYDGKVPTIKTIEVDDVSYFLGGDPDTSSWYEGDFNNHTGFWVIVDSTNYSLDGRKMWHASINGTSIWQPMIIGGTLDYGTFDGLAMDFEGQIITPYNYYVDYYWNSTYNYESDWRVDFYNGTIINCEPRTLFEVYLVDANGTEVYTYNTYPHEEWISEMEQYYYIEDLDGVRYYVDSYRERPMLDVVIAEGWEVWDIDGTATFHYFVNGTEYIEPYTGGHWGITAMVFTNSTYAGKYFFRYSDHENRAYNITYLGSNYNVTSHHDYMYEIASVEGMAYVYKLAPIESVTFKNFNEIIVGNPRWAMWGMKSWDVSETNNALDLDGDASTTDDQYYVLSEYQSTNSYNNSWSRLWVNLQWDPNGTLYGDEMNTYSWMGIETNTWSYEWQDTYYWYHAGDFSPVSSAEWDGINSTIFNEDGTPRAGYWDISHMARNVTWADILAEAEANGWDWYSQEEQTWTWLSFGVGQNYGVQGEHGWSSMNLRYEYSGLMLWEDLDNNSILEAYMNNPGDGELSHYFIPDSVDSVSFVTPGRAYGNLEESGSLLLGLEDEVTWGVTFHDVNGTTFPFNTYAYWDWYSGVVTGSDLRTFDERPTKVSIDEISFLVHFQGFINTTEGATSNYASMKVDNTIGQWYINGQAGHSDLVNRSLALNYLADISTSQFRSGNSTVTQEETVVSNRFEIGDNTARFAEMIMGGVTYEWAYDPYTAYNVTSQTTRASTFSSAYQSDDGKSATSWTFSSTQYYVSIGFPAWDGYYVYQDPVFVGYISNAGSTGVQFNSMSMYPEVPASADSVSIDVDVLTTLEIDRVDLYYSTDGFNFDRQIGMYETYDHHYTGSIEPYPENTQVWYKVVVKTISSGTFESNIESYIVGVGSVEPTTSATTTTTTTIYTGNGEGLSIEVLMMIGGIGVVVVILGMMAKRRK
ncbi:hypothetical protein EU528_08500 [Candidatus Thorarchaeota archaeon]|nr:MAG: hypothetical protein EU528_08500 [Candidatus Thorarchaeota archaeon]